MRFFQEHEYVSLDFTRQDVLRVRVESSGSQPEIKFEKVPTTPEEPLHGELRGFLECVRSRRPPIVDGAAGRRALELADRVMAATIEHAQRVQLGTFAPQEVR
jgi:predicted dehydrogenase